VAKATFEAAVDLKGAAGADARNPLAGIPGRGFQRTAEDAARFLAFALPLLPSNTRLAVAMEATGRYSMELAAWLRQSDETLLLAIVDPYKVHNYAKSLGTRNQTDPVDARIIARFATERRPVIRPKDPPEYERLRELTRERQRVVEDRCRLENRAKEGATLECVRRLWSQEIALLKEHEKALETEIERLTRESDTLRDDNERMRQLAGVARVVSSVLQAEGGDPRRYATARAYVAFCGASPETKESGSSVKRSRLSKRGSPRLRRALYLAAMTAVRSKKPNRFRVYYERRVGKGMSRKAALWAVARKMLATIHCMITRGQPYDDAHTPTWANTGKRKKARPGSRST
jgi:transposase